MSSKKRIHREEPKTERYRLERINIKEISNKYPDKVTGVEQKGDKSILVLDTCKIVFGDKFNKNSSTKRINKQLRNNKANQ